MKYICSLLVLLFTSVFICHAQKYGVEKADSLIEVLAKEKTSVSRVKLMTDISVLLYCFNPEKGLGYSAQALELSKKSGYEKGLGLSYYAAGVNYIFLGDFPRSIENLSKAKAILEKTGDNAMLARCCMRIGGAHEFVMHYDTALAYTNKAMQLIKLTKDSTVLAECYGLLGMIYGYKYSYDSVIQCYDKGLSISRQLGQQDITGIMLAALGGCYLGQNNYIKSSAYSFDAMKLLEKVHGGFLSVPILNIATIYLVTSDNSKARVYLQKALDAAEMQNDKYRIGNSLNLLGSLNKEEKDYADALKNYLRSLEIFKQINNSAEISHSYSEIGDTYHRMGNYTSALDYLFVALNMINEQDNNFLKSYILYVIGDVYLQLLKKKTNEWPDHSKIPHNRQLLLQKTDNCLVQAKGLALEAGFLDNLVFILKDLSELKLLQGKPELALDAYKESVVYNDSINSIAKTNDFARKEIEYEYSKQQDSIKLVNEKKDAISKARYELQQKETEEERGNKRIAAIGVIILLLVSIFIYYLFVQRRKLSTQLATSLTILKQTQAQLIHIEKEKEGEKIRQGISRDLHDNLGSTLSGIAIYSHMMDNQLKSGNYENAKTSVSVIQRSANEVVGKLSDLVWSANPGQDSLQQLLERLQQYGLDMCSSKNIEFKMENTSSPATFNLPAEQRYYIYLVAKEAINNAVKYSNANLLELKVKEIPGMLEVAIIDNGIGFTMDEIKKGNGLDNMEKRMAEISANYKLDSNPGEGTTVSIQLKFT